MNEAANSNNQAQSFDMRKDDAGWTVYDIATYEPARVNGVPQTGLSIEVADDLVDLLNTLAREKNESTGH
ncbi:hypothetical protein FV232_24265 [Methylobacterium sp. WL30]|uniref:hypothetical protein n=1 Tax=Methylobacterium sp. WL30 TaxID=2603895 RepID=UPI0011C80490|nr:hypothetical protein [Methylobacterium sp. WL30]TXN62994.1 hypothetical protein FV232_24265 [Methylobacterium sp. WL30]